MPEDNENTYKEFRTVEKPGLDWVVYDLQWLLKQIEGISDHEVIHRKVCRRQIQ